MLELPARGVLPEGTGRADTADRAHGPGCFCTILLLDESRPRLMAGSAGSLPEEYIRAVNGLQIRRSRLLRPGGLPESKRSHWKT